jgi:prepilin-type N-terminal cleavage/methylation domain-containing protein
MLMKKVDMRQNGERGFTLVELLVAMSVFSFMLVIVVVGFINIVHLHNQALASNAAQDNARAGMDELVRAVRDSAGVVSTTPGPNGRLCLASPTGQQRVYYLVGGVLTRADNCAAPVAGTIASITSSAVTVSNFAAVVQSTGPKVVKPVVQLTLTLGSSNGTTTGTGAALTCGTSNSARTFCSTVTLTSGAVPR